MKILYISEDKDSWDKVSLLFQTTNSNLEFVFASTPEEVMDQGCQNGPYAFYVLDVNMDCVDINAMMMNLLEFTGKRPIFYTGDKAAFENKINETLLKSNVYNAFIFKPYDQEDFMDNLNAQYQKAMNWVKKEDFGEKVIESDSSEYLHMKLKSFYLYDQFPYDIYLKITQKSYSKLIKANSRYSHSTLATYAKRNVKFLYVQKDDMLKFLGAEKNKCHKALKIIKLDKPEIYLVYLRTITLIHQFVRAIGVTPEIIELCDHVIQKIIDIQEVKTIHEVIKEYPKVYPGIASKSLLTAFLANELAETKGWKSQSTKRKLTMAAILQDITLEDDDHAKILNLAANEYLELNDDEQLDFREHPNKAGDLAKLFTTYPDLDSLVIHHHELPNNKGFPNFPSNKVLTSNNAVFNISVLLATKLDGKEFSYKLITNSLSDISKILDLALFKEPLKLMQKALKKP